MRKVRWVAARSTHRRVLRPQDFAQLGVEHDKEEIFSKDNGFTLELNNKVGDRLVEQLPEEFVLVGSDDDPGVPEQGFGENPVDQADEREPDSQSSDSQVNEKSRSTDSSSKRAHKA